MVFQSCMTGIYPSNLLTALEPLHMAVWALLMQLTDRPPIAVYVQHIRWSYVGWGCPLLECTSVNVAKSWSLCHLYSLAHPIEPIQNYGIIRRHLSFMATYHIRSCAPLCNVDDPYAKSLHLNKKVVIWQVGSKHTRNDHDYN